MSTKERQQQACVALEAAVARLSPLPLPQLAAELMAPLKPESPDAMPQMISAPQLALEFAPDSNMLLGVADNLNRQRQVRCPFRHHPGPAAGSRHQPVGRA
jgi:hypothetical protein